MSDPLAISSRMDMVMGVEECGSDMERKRATYADLEALPANQVGELIDGVLYASPRPAARHAASSSLLGGELHGAFVRGRGGPGGWWILDEPELHFDDDVLVPDMAGWRRERMPEIPSTATISLAPDWVCEVLSPATMALDRTGKLPVYASEHVKHVWLVDPIARTLEIFRQEGEHYLLCATHSGRGRVRAEPFEELELELAVLWGEVGLPSKGPDVK